MRKRKKIEPVIYEGGFTPGNVVIVTSRTTFRGSAIGAVLPPQKWCDGGIPVQTTHETYINLCIRISNGDTITNVSKIK